MGGTEITEYERLQRAHEKGVEASQQFLDNGVNGTGLLENDYQNSSDVGSLSTSKNPYGSIDELANRPGRRIDLSAYQLGGADGLAQTLVSDLSSGMIEPHKLRRYITTNLDLSNPAHARMELLNEMAKIDPDLRAKLQQPDLARQLNDAEKLGGNKAELAKQAILDKLLFDHLMDLHQQGLQVRQPGERQRAEGMGNIIRRYFDPEAKINTSTNPREKAEAIVTSLSSKDLTHQQREQLREESLEILKDMPELRSKVRAEIRLIEDMARTGAVELHDALKTDDPTAALGAVLIGKSRGGNLDEIQLVLDAYREKFPGKDFEADLKKAHKDGKISDEQLKFLERLIEKGFQPADIAESLRVDLDTIRTNGNIGNGAQGLIAGTAVIGTFLMAAKGPVAGNGALASMRNNSLFPMAGGLALAYGAEVLEQQANKDNYANIVRVLGGLSAEQMMLVQKAYAGRGLIDTVTDEVRDLSFATATRTQAHTATEQQDLAKKAIEAVRTAKSPDEAAGKLLAIFNGLDEKTADNVIALATAQIIDGYTKAVEVPVLDADNKPIIDPATGKAKMEVKRKPDNSPEMSLQVPPGEASDFLGLVTDKLRANTDLLNTVNRQMLGFNARDRVATTLAIVGQTAALRNPDSATEAEKAEFRQVVQASIQDFTEDQLTAFREEWKLQLGSRSELAADITDYVRNPEVHATLRALLQGNNRLWHLGAAHYENEPSDAVAFGSPVEALIVEAGIKRGSDGLISSIDCLHRSLHVDNNPAQTRQAVRLLKDNELGALDNLHEALHGPLDMQVLDRHLDAEHKSAVDLGFNPWTRAQALEELVRSGGDAEVTKFLEGVAGPTDPARNPDQAKKMELFLDVYGRAHLAEQLRDSHPEVLKSVIQSSQNRALQLGLKDFIEEEIAGTLSDSSLEIDKRAEIAQNFYSAEFLAQGINDPQIIKDALSAVDIATSTTFTPAQYDAFVELINKNASVDGRIGKAYTVAMMAKPELLETLYELTVPVRYEAFQSRLKTLDIDLNIDSIEPLSDLVRTGANRGNMELVYNFSTGREKFAINHEKMAHLEGLVGVIEETIAANPSAADATKLRGKEAIEIVLRR